MSTPSAPGDPGPGDPEAREPTRPALRVGVVVLGLVGFVPVALRFLPAPWAFLLAAAAFGALVLAASSRSEALRGAGLALASVLLVGALCEAGLSVLGQLSRRHTLQEPTLAEPDERLGYAGVRDTTVIATRKVGDEEIYRARYTLDARGLRATPAASEVAAAACAVFLGGSFTFGEGVADDETLPAQVVRLSGGRWSAWNLGFVGHGAHQMHVRLQDGAEAELPGCTPRVAVYQAIVDHVRRAAGRHAWDVKGPRFELDDAGALVRRGFYENGPAAERRRGYGHWAISRSAIAKRVRAYRSARIRPGDVARFAALVADARRLFEARHPGARFHVLLWDAPEEPDREAVAAALTAAGVPLHRVSEILPGYAEDSARWTLSPQDMHPSPEAHVRLARSLLEAVLEPSRTP